MNDLHPLTIHLIRSAIVQAVNQVSAEQRMQIQVVGARYAPGIELIQNGATSSEHVVDERDHKGSRYN